MLAVLAFLSGVQVWVFNGCWQQPLKEIQTMDATVDYNPRRSPQERASPSRRGVADVLGRFEQLDSPWTSHRQIAGQLQVAPSTLYHWIARHRAVIRDSSWPANVARFFDSPEGLAFLHRLLSPAHLVFVQANDCGIRHLSFCLELSGAQQAV